MKNVLILGSGGIDSTACIQFYRNLDFHIDILFIDYGQVARKMEFIAIKSIADFYNVKVEKIVVKNLGNFEIGMIKGRNAFLLFTALMNYKKYGVIATGIHSGTNYYDCSVDFFNQMQIIFERYTQGQVKIDAPFLTFNKSEIFDYCIIENVPISLTYSCELGLAQTCGKCATCKDLEVIYARKN